MAAVKAVLSALADDRSATCAVDEVQMGALSLDGRRSEDKIDREVVGNLIQDRRWHF